MQTRAGCMMPGQVEMMTGDPRKCPRAANTRVSSGGVEDSIE